MSGRNLGNARDDADRSAGRFLHHRGVVALLVPAIAGGREMARLNQCANNLKQLNLGMHNHHSTHDVFPSGVQNLEGPIRNEPVGFHQSWVVALLPFLEQGRLAGVIDDGLGVYAEPSQGAHGGAQDADLSVGHRPATRKDGVAENNYAGCHHDVEAAIDADNHGVLYLNSWIRYEDVEDGLSETLMIGERLRSGFDLGWASGTRATLRNTGSPDQRG